MDFVYVLYNLNNPNNETIYSTDLFDLFGSPDGLTKGFVYTIKKLEHKTLRWDWGISGFKNVAMALFYKAHNSLQGFSSFYDKFKKSEIKFSDVFEFPVQAVYQVKPNNDNAILFPAFILNIYDIEKVDGRIFLTFAPYAYFIVDPETWKQFLNTRNKLGDWDDFCGDKELMQEILRAPAQAQHRIYPKTSFEKMLSFSQANTIFYKQLDLYDRRISERNILDNQIFWNMYQYFTKQCQVVGDAIFKYKGKPYEIKNISTNSLSKANACYKHEIGAPQAIYSALSSCFESSFLDEEFAKSESISLNNSKFLKRAYQINNFNRFNPAYSNTDYDYALNLSPLGINRRICFDLTVGLWNKGRDKSINEYIEQWRHNIVLMPSYNPEIITVFFFGLKEDEKIFFRKQGRYESIHDFIGDLVDGSKFVIFSNKNTSIESEHRIIFIPFFGKCFDLELNNLLLSPRESLLYNALFKLFECLSN